MEEVKKGQNFKVIIDFAHAPNSLKNALEVLNKEKKEDNKLIAVFGAAGLRDRKKRPLMGKISGKYADITVITAEDPRTEDLNEIIEKIAQGCLKSGAIEQGKDKFKIDNRKNCFLGFLIEKKRLNLLLENWPRKMTLSLYAERGMKKQCVLVKKNIHGVILKQ